ncbi:hypothetical protein CSC94_14560, partial [Zhengella mangrovi]
NNGTNRPGQGHNQHHAGWGNNGTNRPAHGHNQQQAGWGNHDYRPGHGHHQQQAGWGNHGMNRPGHGNHGQWGGHHGTQGNNPAGNNGGGSGTGKVYHDPQVLGAQKQRFEFKGANGDAYNLLSTEDMRVNGRMATKGNSTVLDQIGVVDNRGNRIQVDLGGQLTINGRQITGNGQYLNGEVTLNGKNVTVDYDGSTVEIVDRGTWFNTNFTLDNAQYAGGVWGQTVGTANPNAQMITDEATFQRRNIFA